MALDFYLTLLQLHTTIVGLVIAGIVALVQLLNNTKPHRDIRLLVRRRFLGAYAVLLAALMIVLSLATWTSAFPQQANVIFGTWIEPLFSQGMTGLIIISLSLCSLAWFAYLALKARTLLDSQQYLVRYVEHTPAASVRRYLTAIYTDSDSADLPVTLFDPFQPIREYTKDNAFKYYDYGTADGLKHFSVLYDKALAAVTADAQKQTGHDPSRGEFVRLARYTSDSAVEFFAIFAKTASEKRKLDTIHLLHQKGELMLQTGSDAALLPIVRGLETIAKLSDDDDEIIATINHIRHLCDTFLKNHRKHSWDHVAGPFDEICLSVSRITETYYLQKNNTLKTVPIIGFETGQHQTVTAALVDFFCAYRDLGDRYEATLPGSYFAAIESVIEVLFVRLRDIVDNDQLQVGFNQVYQRLARDLYLIYYGFGIDAVEHNKPQLFALVLSNLRRVVKPAKNFKLAQEHQDLCAIIVELACKATDRFGDIAIKDNRTIKAYTSEILSKHATHKQIATAIATYETKPANIPPSHPVKILLKQLQTLQ